MKQKGDESRDDKEGYCFNVDLRRPILWQCKLGFSTSGDVFEDRWSRLWNICKKRCLHWLSIRIKNNMVWRF